MPPQKADRRIINAPKDTESFGYKFWEFLGLETNDANEEAEALQIHANMLSSIIHGTQKIMRPTVDKKGWRDVLRDRHPEKWDPFYPAFDAWVESLETLSRSKRFAARSTKHDWREAVGALLNKLLQKQGEDVFCESEKLAKSVESEKGHAELRHGSTWREIRCGTKMSWAVYAAALGVIIKRSGEMGNASVIKDQAMKMKPVLDELAEGEKNSPCSTEKPGRSRKFSDRSQAPAVLWSSSSCVVD